MTIHNTPPTNFMSQSLSMYKSTRIQLFRHLKKEGRYELDYREALSSPKISKNNVQFNSCYCGTLLDYCHSCVSGLCTIHHTIKCNSECEHVFYVSCTDINKNVFFK